MLARKSSNTQALWIGVARISSKKPRLCRAFKVEVWPSGRPLLYKVREVLCVFLQDFKVGFFGDRVQLAFKA